MINRIKEFFQITIPLIFIKLYGWYLEYFYKDMYYEIKIHKLLAFCQKLIKNYVSYSYLHDFVQKILLPELLEEDELISTYIDHYEEICTFYNTEATIHQLFSPAVVAALNFKGELGTYVWDQYYKNLEQDLLADENVSEKLKTLYLEQLNRYKGKILIYTDVITDNIYSIYKSNVNLYMITMFFVFIVNHERRHSKQLLSKYKSYLDNGIKDRIEDTTNRENAIEEYINLPHEKDASKYAYLEVLKSL